MTSFVDRTDILEHSESMSADRAYSRPILRLTIECCPLLRKLCRDLLNAKHLEKALNRGVCEIFGVLSSKKPLFFIKKCPLWPISNTALNFYNMSWLIQNLYFGV